MMKAFVFAINRLETQYHVSRLFVNWDTSGTLREGYKVNICLLVLSYSGNDCSTTFDLLYYFRGSRLPLPSGWKHLKS